ncbi:MAG: site-2 protease family protein, partial [Candidatus Sacchiramonaceae bacterium]|nr:site-2 protease family protein [Candidatus Saccharimonadaceae bacterium]
MMLIFGIFIGLLVLTILVALHELGHAYAAIKNGVKLEEFGLGFPPTAYKFKKKTDKILPRGTVIAINWLPLGGYVKLKGEHDSDSKKGDYGAASFWGKTQILFAGVAVNWLVAAVLFTILAWTGLPKALDNQFHIASDARITGGETVVVALPEDMPAAESGIEVGDEIIAVDGQEILLPSEIGKMAESKSGSGENLTVRVLRNGESKDFSVRVRDNNDDGKGFIGLASQRSGEKIYTTWSAPIVGVGTTLQFTGATFKGLGDLAVNFFSGLANRLSFSESSRQIGAEKMSQAGEGVAGPIGIIGVIFPQAAQSGATTVLFLAALISLTLATMNVLPIPALDGGRWLMT